MFRYSVYRVRAYYGLITAQGSSENWKRSEYSERNVNVHVFI